MYLLISLLITYIKDYLALQVPKDFQASGITYHKERLSLESLKITFYQDNNQKIVH